MEKERKYWLDFVKIVAAFAVIVNHTIGVILEYSIHYKGISFFYCLSFAMCKIGVPLFLMVTGSLFLSKKKTESYLSCLKRIGRVGVPLIIISFLLYIKNTGLEYISLFDFVNQFLKNPQHIYLWYLYMLLGIYLILPFIQKMVKSFTNKDYIFFVIVFLVLPSMLLLLTNLKLLSISQYFTIAFFPITISLLIAGNFLSKIKLKRQYFIISVIVYMVFTFLFVYQMYNSFRITGSISYLLDSWSYATSVMPALALFYGFRYLFENKVFSNLTRKAISTLSLCTFGIYLLHPLINMKIYHFELIQTIFQFNPYIGIIMLEFMIFLICFLIIFFLRKIPFFKYFL